MCALRATTYGDGLRKVATVFNASADDAQAWSDVDEHLCGFVIDKARGPFRRILTVVRSRGCRTAVIEERYIDADYRSEYGAFWAGRFEDRPPQARRVHFFTDAFDASLLPRLPKQHGYLGYCVIRPTTLGAVGRTVIRPPLQLDGAHLTMVIDRPSLFGNPLEVEGVPFSQQDGELLRCADASAWLCHYVAYHQRICGRLLTADIARLPSGEGSRHRALPSTGLTGEQLQAVFSAIGIPAFFYEVAKLPKLPAEMRCPRGRSNTEHNRRIRDERVSRVVCKYLNSGFPVVVLTESEEGHAFTLVGWQRSEDSVRLIACDDQVGPYEVIESPELDASRRGSWKGLMLPLPAKVFLTGEAAESRARQYVLAERDQAEMSGASGTDLSEIAQHLEDLAGPISVRARLMEGRRYKAVAARQSRDPESVRISQMTHLPHWVWVVEFHDRAARVAGEACVEAEIVFDSTSHDDIPILDVVTTRSIAFDVRSANAEEPQRDAALYVGQLDGRRWRSLISDNTVNLREYG